MCVFLGGGGAVKIVVIELFIYPPGVAIAPTGAAKHAKPTKAAVLYSRCRTYHGTVAMLCCTAELNRKGIST